jgi:hypothetical protein
VVVSTLKTDEISELLTSRGFSATPPPTMEAVAGGGTVVKASSDAAATEL